LIIIYCNSKDNFLNECKHRKLKSEDEIYIGNNDFDLKAIKEKPSRVFVNFWIHNFKEVKQYLNNLKERE